MAWFPTSLTEAPEDRGSVSSRLFRLFLDGPPGVAFTVPGVVAAAPGVPVCPVAAGVAGVPGVPVAAAAGGVAVDPGVAGDGATAAGLGATAAI